MRSNGRADAETVDGIRESWNSLSLAAGSLSLVGLATLVVMIPIRLAGDLTNVLSNPAVGPVWPGYWVIIGISLLLAAVGVTASVVALHRREMRRTSIVGMVISCVALAPLLGLLAYFYMLSTVP